MKKQSAWLVTKEGQFVRTDEVRSVCILTSKNTNSVLQYANGKGKQGPLIFQSEFFAILFQSLSKIPAEYEPLFIALPLPHEKVIKAGATGIWTLGYVNDRLVLGWLKRQSQPVVGSSRRNHAPME